MKLHKVDIDHLPDEKVLAVNKEGGIAIGKLKAWSDGDVIAIGSGIRNVTHYILKSDIIKAKEQLK